VQPARYLTRQRGQSADGRVSLFNGLNSHTRYPKQAWELEQWPGSPQSKAILGSGGLCLGRPSRASTAFPAVLAGPGIGDALTEVANDLGPAWPGTEPVSQALQTAQTDADYVLRTS
jgi:hypothetical protein